MGDERTIGERLQEGRSKEPRPAYDYERQPPMQFREAPRAREVINHYSPPLKQDIRFKDLSLAIQIPIFLFWAQIGIGVLLFLIFLVNR